MTDDLEHLFASARAARANAPPPSEALMARVLADALAQQPQPLRPGLVRGAVVRRAPVRRPGLWARFAAALGGGGVLAGLGTAAAAGVMIGFAQPETLSVVTGGLFETSLDAVDLVPTLDPFLSEG